MCGICNGDSRKCGCQEPPTKKEKASSKKNPKAAKKQPIAANSQPPAATAAVTPPQLPPPPTSSTPETEENYKSLCRQLQQKNQQLGKAYKYIKAKFDALERKCLEQEEHLQQAQDDSDEMVQFVREVEEKEAAYREKIKESTAHIKALERQLHEPRSNGAEPTTETSAAAKVDCNDLEEVHRRYENVLSVLAERKSSLNHVNNAYRMAGTARSTIRDFLGIIIIKCQRWQ